MWQWRCEPSLPALMVIRGERKAHLACSFANPLWTWTLEEIPGNKLESKFSMTISISVKSATLLSIPILELELDLFLLL